VAEVEPKPLPKTDKTIGIDVGIENFATLSDGTQIKNFKYYEKSQKKLRVAQRRVSRRKKGSDQRQKAILQLGKIYRQIKKQREDFQHKLSINLVRKFDLLAIENLNIVGMCKGFLSRQIHDVAWSSFFRKLTYKAEYAGRQLIKVNPNGTSQTCVCGEPNKKDLSVRWHQCLSCGMSCHRDIVSAQVILKLGLGNDLKDITYRATESVSLEAVCTSK
jgi:putative transposase